MGVGPVMGQDEIERPSRTILRVQQDQCLARTFVLRPGSLESSSGGFCKALTQRESRLMRGFCPRSMVKVTSPSVDHTRTFPSPWSERSSAAIQAPSAEMTGLCKVRNSESSPSGCAGFLFSCASVVAVRLSSRARPGRKIDFMCRWLGCHCGRKLLSHMM